MTTAPLDTRLRRLRLGYMAQSVDAHNTESIRQKHSFLEFLGASSMASSTLATTRA
jgi:hypothetical protein